MYLQKLGIVDTVMSTDGDCIIHGVERLYFNVNFDTSTFQVFNRKVDYLNTVENPLFAYDCNKWPIIGILLGCDYIK